MSYGATRGKCTVIVNNFGFGRRRGSKIIFMNLKYQIIVSVTPSAETENNENRRSVHITLKKRLLKQIEIQEGWKKKPKCGDRNYFKLPRNRDRSRLPFYY